MQGLGRLALVERDAGVARHSGIPPPPGWQADFGERFRRSEGAQEAGCEEQASHHKTQSEEVCMSWQMHVTKTHLRVSLIGPLHRCAGSRQQS